MAALSDETASCLGVLDDMEFHHLGVAVGSLCEAVMHWSVLGYERSGGEFVDPEQGVRGQFLTGPGPRIELLTALPDSRTLDVWLRPGSNVYHFAYLVVDVEKALTALRSRGAVVVRRPATSVAFPGRRIAFLMLDRGMLIEVIG